MMMTLLFGRRRDTSAAPLPCSECAFVNPEEEAAERAQRIEELAQRAHNVARRVHVLEWQTMPDFDQVTASTAQRRDGEPSDD